MAIEALTVVAAATTVSASATMPCPSRLLDNAIMDNNALKSIKHCQNGISSSMSSKPLEGLEAAAAGAGRAAGAAGRDAGAGRE